MNTLTIDTGRRIAYGNGQPLKLTRLGYALLLTMAREPHNPFSRDLLIDEVWHGSVPPDSRAPDAKITELRKQLPHGCMQTRPGFGWVLTPGPDVMTVEFARDPNLAGDPDDALAHVERAFELALAYVRRARRGATNGEQ